jgi:hypothetical protein
MNFIVNSGDWILTSEHSISKRKKEEKKRKKRKKRKERERELKWEKLTSSTLRQRRERK